MPDVAEISDPDFAEQMLGLGARALQEQEGRVSKVDDPDAAVDMIEVPVAVEKAIAGAAPSLPPAAPILAAPGVQATVPVSEMLRPVIQGMQAMGRTSGEHGQILMRLDKALTETREAEKELPRVVAELRGLTEQRNSISRTMFDALHEELKSYKDGFLLDTVHRPMIRDLITLYDDLSLIHHQMKAPIEMAAGALQQEAVASDFTKRMVSLGLHVEHNLDFILEVLARLDVSQLPLGKGKLDKKTQRAVDVEAAEDPDDDLTVVRTLKRGFIWKERIVRAEEVVIRKWKEGFLMALKCTED